MYRSSARVSNCIIIVALFSSLVSAAVYLPGTQPEENDIKFTKIKSCKLCHSKTGAGQADPYFSWHGGMMSQAARDPIYRAALTIANQDVPGVGEFCWRCHTPRGWLEGRSTKADGSNLNDEDMNGVSCHVCHRLVDPLSDEAKKFARDIPPGYGNAMIVADTEKIMRGPYSDINGKPINHKVVKSDFHASGKLCGLCHDVSNPLFAKDVKTQHPYEFGHVERTFSEWSLSAFPAKGEEGSCQHCHYKKVEGGAKASKYSKMKRDHFVTHGPAGGSTWVQDAVAYLWKDADISKEALEVGKERAKALLRTASKLELKIDSKNQATLRITNLTGHKLPTGYPEGRRMWINSKFIDASGKVIKETGKYGQKEATVAGKKVIAETLLDPEDTKIYESLPAISSEQAAKTGKLAGPSFHFVLNDIIAKDNRIPPEGFVNSKFKEHLCEPVGATYADGQNYDDTKLDIPPGTKKIAVRIMYQSMSWEYLKFLVEENKTDDWGKKLYDAWENTGKCQPFVIAEIDKEI